MYILKSKTNIVILFSNNLKKCLLGWFLNFVTLLYKLVYKLLMSGHAEVNIFC